jgi:hypothetical protein
MFANFGRSKPLGICAGLRRIQISQPCCADSVVSCFLDLLPLVIRGSATSDTG